MVLKILLLFFFNQNIRHIRVKMTHWYVTVGLVDFDCDIRWILILLDNNRVCVTDSEEYKNEEEEGGELV